MRDVDVSQVTKDLESGNICSANRIKFEDAVKTFDEIAQQNEKNRSNDSSLPKITVTHGLDSNSNQTLGLSVDKITNVGYLKETRDSKSGIVVAQMSKPCSFKDDSDSSKKLDIGELTKAVEKGDICAAHSFKFDAAAVVFDLMAQQNEKNRNADGSLPKITVSQGVDSNSNQTLGFSVDKIENVGYLKRTLDSKSGIEVAQMSRPCPSRWFSDSSRSSTLPDSNGTDLDKEMKQYKFRKSTLTDGN